MLKRLYLSLLTKSTHHLRWLWGIYHNIPRLLSQYMTWSGSLWKKLINIKTTTNAYVPNVTYIPNMTFFATILTNHHRRIILFIFSNEIGIFLIWFSKAWPFITWIDKIILCDLESYVNYSFKLLISNFKPGQKWHLTTSTIFLKVLEILNWSLTKDICFSFKDIKHFEVLKLFKFYIILFLWNFFLKSFHENIW